MKIGYYEVELNGHRLLSLGTEYYEFPLTIFGIRIPSVSLPFQKKNEFGEWERILAISAPTIIEWMNISDISWEFHFRVLGFGFVLCHQYSF